ncbi:MAG: DUF3106 domain-containing protein [Candidatus Acidiferrum sp.]
MRIRLQLVAWMIAVGLSAVLAAPGLAQRGRARFMTAQEHRAPRMQTRREARQQQHQQQKNAARTAQQERRQNEGAANSGGNRPNSAARPNGNPNRPPSAYVPPAPQKRFSDLTPQQQQRVLENYNRLNKMAPAQRQELRERIATWNRLTPAQKNHIRNDVLPKWRQMPLERRQAIRQRLRVLQNMPEFARNERLNDPKFTEGMSEEDKATLRDLSHLHVGGPPDAPNE